MRKPRIIGEREVNYYHVMSRVVNRDHIFGDEEKEFFRRTMRRLEAFTGLHILTYCVMSNHWHILVKVPNLHEISDDELLQRLHRFYSRAQFADILQDYERCKKYAAESGNEDWLNEFRAKYTIRMGNLSVFVKELKERFSKWYNRKHQRRGTLWEERFKSVLVEGSDHALSTLAAYIDLNPVRAAIVADPRDYRFCGYAEAVAGGHAAREGISSVLRMLGQEESWRKTAAKYRTYLFSTGGETEEKTGFNPAQIKQVLNEGGKLSLKELIHCHVRYFNDGVALGSRLFVEEVFNQNRRLFGERRKDGARAMRGGDWQGLYSMRALSRDALMAPG